MRAAAQEHGWQLNNGEDLVGRDNVALYDTFSGAVVALQNSDVSGVIIDGTSAAAYEKEFAGSLIIGIEGLQADPLGLVFSKGDEKVAAFNEGLAAIQADGTMDTLVAKYWGTE